MGAAMSHRMTRTPLHASLLAGVLLAASGLAVTPAPLAAQAVVQPLPSRAAGELSAAMRRLAQRPSDLEALLSAGKASLALRDAGAAAGFFTRAAAVAPADPRVMIGQARVALEQRRPVEALQLFARAEQAGVRPLEIAADRGLALDLVGDNAAAQVLYRNALAAGEDAEVRRRLALSLAISGDRLEFERTLSPLLQSEDRAGFRTRAFGLAVLGLTDDAVGIADAMMPTDLALRMAPYLRYMPRLTRAQQAAAGNLGVFPAASEIGRDRPDIAGYAAAGTRIAARADASLTPAGEALGARREPTTPPPRLAARASRQPVAAPTSRPAIPAKTVPPIASAAGPPAPAPASDAQPERISLADAFADLGPAPVAAAAPAAGAVDVARLAAAQEKARRETEARDKARRAAEARDAKIKADKERAERAKAEKAKAEKAAREAEPARFWIQVGVGRNLEAYAFDWRRLTRQAGGALDGKGPWAAKYGATNRMLAGPYATEAAARAALKQLKDKGIEALPFKSAQGEKVSKAD